MDEHELFNSSDIEFSPVQKRYANAGATSTASMREKLFEDRISSKRVRGLTDTREGQPLDMHVPSGSTGLRATQNRIGRCTLVFFPVNPIAPFPLGSAPSHQTRKLRSSFLFQHDFSINAYQRARCTDQFPIFDPLQKNDQKTLSCIERTSSELLRYPRIRVESTVTEGANLYCFFCNDNVDTTG